MTKPAALIAFALLATPALADTSVSVMLTHNDADGVITLGETVEYSLWIEYAGFDPGWVAGLSDITITGDNTVGMASDFAYEFFNGGVFNGTSNGAGVSNVQFGNAPFCITTLCDPVNTDNPLLAGTFDYTALDVGDATLSLSEGTATWDFVVMQFDIMTSQGFSQGDVAVSIDSLTVVPTPASALLLGSAGLLATRRRR